MVSTLRIGPIAPPLVLHVRKSATTGEALLSYDRPLAAVPSDYILEISQDLSTWTNVTASIIGETVTPLDALTEQVVERINLRSGPAAEYFRIRTR